MSDNPLSPSVSPLLEADASSINELIQNRIDDIFNKPPLLLSDDDLRFQVEYYRKERARFLIESQQQKQPKEKAPKKTKAVPVSVVSALANLV